MRAYTVTTDEFQLRTRRGANLAPIPQPQFVAHLRANGDWHG
jgi:hypothetical protein